MARVTGARGGGVERRPNPLLRRAGMREVAERAGVAISSVSRVISDHPDVSEKMRARVLAAIEELGFQPHALAQSLRTGETFTIGFVAADIGNPLFAQIAMGAETTLRHQGYSMFVANSFNEPGLALQHVQSMEQRRVDGLLISVSDESDEALRKALENAHFPVTLIDREIEDSHAAAVLSDHESGIRAAAEHLIGLGHRRIALVNGSSKVRPSRERASALRKVARQNPQVSAIIRTGEFSAEHGQQTTTELMASADPPTAIIAGSNQILVGVLRALRELSLSIPGDVSLVTCDDVALSEFLTPALSTISRDSALIGQTAAELVLAQLAGEEGAETLLPTGFRITDSCGPPRVSTERPSS